ALQTHTPPTQALPAAHWPPVLPHTHTPEPLQVSAAVIEQDMQVLPPLPQALVERELVRQLPPLAPPLQQPPSGVQEVASHTHVLLRQRWPAAQAVPPPHWQVPLTQLSAVMPQFMQAWPGLPQVVTEMVEQVPPFMPPWQQPLWHEIESQMQMPLL